MVNMFSNLPTEKIENGWMAYVPGNRNFFRTAATPEEAQKRLGTFLLELDAKVNFYGEFIREGDVCFDVGANVGERSAVFCSMGARVIAVEPQPQIAEVLRNHFQGCDSIVIEQVALGEKEGEAEMHIADLNVLSSLSTEWIEKVKESGRFKGVGWNRTEKVKMTTLDSLIQKYGVPAFIKIDVEGYEYNVIKGLSVPVNAVSLEFVTEHLAPPENCIRHLAAIGPIEGNLSYGESMSLALPNWVSGEALIDILRSLDNSKLPWGDIYLRFIK